MGAIILIEYQRVWAEVNLDHIAHNMRQIRKFVGSKCEIMAVVKAEGYGHGAIETSKVMLYNGANSLGVATCDEGIKIRENNIFVEVLVLGHTPKERLADVINNDLTQTVFQKEAAVFLSSISSQQKKVAKINIKIDTGMGRLGFKPNKETVQMVLEISRLPNINVTGVYSHLAMSDTIDKSFTYEQYEKFMYVINMLKNAGVDNFKSHICNSGAIINNKDIYMNVVRPGILLYGLSPSLEVDASILNLKPAMSLKTRVSYLKSLDEGISVGYDRTFITKKKTIVATLPIGYADGYSRSLSNKGYVIVGNGYAPIIGRICMDQMMIDVTHIANVKEGDEVLLIGKKNNMEITADKIASLQENISREVLCSIGKRVPRVYIKNNTMLKVVNL